MTDFTSLVQQPSIAGVTPVYTQATVADFFTALPNAKYELHYKNAATPTGALKITDATTQTPTGANVSAGWADVAHTPTSLGASTEKVVTIDNSNRFRDSQGRINLTHVTPTTLTLNIRGPF